MELNNDRYLKLSSALEAAIFKSLDSCWLLERRTLLRTPPTAPSSRRDSFSRRKISISA